jgi:putative ATP-dependent endonuclease of OLD family
MLLKKVYIKGFRNFKEVTCNFDKHSLVIGANDVGKTNLIHALRLLLDKGISDYDAELNESDFYAYEETNEVVIRAYFEGVTEACVTARLGEYISDKGEMVIQYTATLNAGKVDYTYYIGRSDDSKDLQPKENAFYRKHLNLKYIGSRRDFWSYINKTKSLLLTQAKADRDEATVTTDDALYADIEDKLKYVDEHIPELSYVKNATDQINTELNKLSIHNQEQKIVFDTSSTDIDRVISTVSLASKHDDKKMLIGGEGRINQIYLSLWASQNQQTAISNEVSIICVEEPEAYLHPHQQRELAAYLGKTLNGQTILTSHSPFIVSEFSPNSIIRLYKDKETDNSTQVASDGCSEVIGKGIEDFGYRMSVIPAEAFFSDFVVLVEGPSELTFYNTLAKKIDINLDRLNISVLDVAGVGFDVYITILDALCIDWAMRTDNDVMKIPYHDTYRYAGIERGLDRLEESYNLDDALLKRIEGLKQKIHGFDRVNEPAETKKAAKELKEILDDYDIFLAVNDLENDILNSPLRDSLKKFYDAKNKMTDAEIVEKMKEHKAINMFDYLKKHKESLVLLKDDALALPLVRAKERIEEQYGTY